MNAPLAAPATLAPGGRGSALDRPGLGSHGPATYFFPGLPPALSRAKGYILWLIFYSKNRVLPQNTAKTGRF